MTALAPGDFWIGIDPSRDDVERTAIAIWRRREMQFPARCRRMTPDDFDRASGAWTLVLIEAGASLGLDPGELAGLLNRTDRT